MVKEPSELKPKSVRPLKSGNLEKREMYEEVGRAIVHLSEIENWLVAIAYSVATPKAGMKVPEMFYAIFGFEKRFQFADVIVELEARKDEKARWKEATSALKKHRGVRNLIAHQGMVTGFPDKDGRIDVVLQPGDLKNPFGGRQMLRVADVRATASALSKIRDDLEKLWSDIDDSWGSDDPFASDDSEG